MHLVVCSHNCCQLLFVIPLVYQLSLVIAVNFSSFSSIVALSYIKLYLALLIHYIHDAPRLALLPADIGNNCYKCLEYELLKRFLV